MTKSTIIAHCLVNSNMSRTLEEAENRVRSVYADEFPSEQFQQWNTDFSESYAAEQIKMVGCASPINVKWFIQDLWTPPRPHD